MAKLGLTASLCDCEENRQWGGKRDGGVRGKGGGSRVI